MLPNVRNRYILLFGLFLKYVYFVFVAGRMTNSSKPDKSSADLRTELEGSNDNRLLPGKIILESYKIGSYLLLFHVKAQMDLERSKQRPKVYSTIAPRRKTTACDGDFGNKYLIVKLICA